MRSSAKRASSRRRSHQSDAAKTRSKQANQASYTKLDTAEEINDELRRTYRLQRNKQITAAEAKSWRELLVALRSGLPETVERPAFLRRRRPSTSVRPPKVSNISPANRSF